VLGVFCLSHSPQEDNTTGTHKRKSKSSSESSKKKSSVSHDELSKELDQVKQDVHGVTFYHAFTLCCAVSHELISQGVSLVNS